jgi:hypothetical protein
VISITDRVPLTTSDLAGAPSPPASTRRWGLEVPDIEGTVAELKARGVVFEDYDASGLHTRDGIADIEGNYPSKHASGERGAWLCDSEGNLLGTGQLVR